MVGNLGLSTDAAGRTGMPGFIGELSDLLGCCLQGLMRAPRLLQTDFARAQREGERLTLTLPRRDYFLREAATEGETRTFGTRTQLPQGTGAPSARREPPTRRGKALVALQLQIQQRSIARSCDDGLVSQPLTGGAVRPRVFGQEHGTQGRDLCLRPDFILRLHE
jgi:hypothetical protein